MRKKEIILTLAFFCIISNVQAQNEVGASLIENSPRFFVCILAGVILALGFQLLLTIFSVAAGVTAVGDIQNKQNNDTHSGSKSSDDSKMNTAQKISSGIGLWTMVTASVSLFFASLLSVKLSLIGVNFVGVTLGLVIWASFFMVMTFLEVNTISSFLGGLISMVKNALSNLFGKSAENEAKAVAKAGADRNAHALRKEFEDLFDTRHLDKKIEEYIDKLQPQQVDVEQIKKEIKSLITDLQVREQSGYDHSTIKELIFQEADKSSLSEKDKQAIKEHMSQLKNVAQRDASTQEKLKQGIEKLTDADRQQIEKYQAQLKEFFRNTNKEELQTEKLEKDIEAILENPRQAPSILKQKASAIDRQTLVNIVSAREDVTEEEARDYVKKVEDTLQKIQGYFSSKNAEVNDKKDQMHEAKEKVRNIFSQKKGDAAHNFNRIKNDFSSLFNAAGSTEELKYKLKNYNKEQMLAMITSRTDISPEKAEPVVDKIVEARDSVLAKAEEMEMQVKQKVEEVKLAALKEAEETRKAAVTAAWWLVATAVISGIASAVGGMAALDNWIF